MSAGSVPTKLLERSGEAVGLGPDTPVREARNAGGRGLLLLAHGSPDPRHAQGVRRLEAAVEDQFAGPVAIGYLDHHAPDPLDAAQDLLAQGARRAAVLPLFTAAAYHVKVDVPAALAGARAAGLELELVQPGLAGAPELVRAALAEQIATRTPAILLSTGSTDRHACTLLVTQVAELAARHDLPLDVAFMSGGPPLAQVAQGWAATTRVVPFVVAPGIFHDRMAASAAAAGLAFSAPALVDVAAVAGLVAELTANATRLPSHA